MKIAVSGKGGVGKTLFSALLAKKFSESGFTVIAIDADPDANLATTLGFPDAECITPISEMADLIEERTGARPGESAPYFKLSPKVDDIPEKYGQVIGNIRLMIMGRIKRGGAGCYCPENALLQTLMNHLLLARNEVVIMDMEAGIEHLGRGTASAVDELVVVVEPGRSSLETARSIKTLASEIGLENLVVVGNKIRNESDKEYIVSNLPDFEILGFIPYDDSIIEADHAGLSPTESSQPVRTAVLGMYEGLITTKQE